MIHMVVRHKVAEYGRWKESFDAQLGMRKASGETGFRLFVSVDDPREVTVVSDWESLERARRFAASDDLKQAMQRAGVVGDPDVRFLEDAVLVRRSAAD